MIFLYRLSFFQVLFFAPAIGNFLPAWFGKNLSFCIIIYSNIQTSSPEKNSQKEETLRIHKLAQIHVTYALVFHLTSPENLRLHIMEVKQHIPVLMVNMKRMLLTGDSLLPVYLCVNYRWETTRNKNHFLFPFVLLLFFLVSFLFSYFLEFEIKFLFYSAFTGKFSRILFVHFHASQAVT